MVKCFAICGKTKKTNQPYISIAAGNKIEHPALFQGDRKRFKLLYIDSGQDISIKTVNEVFDLAMKHY